MAVSVEQGALDNLVLDEAQTEVSGSVDFVRSLHFNCGRPLATCNASVTTRRSCACRPARLLNVTLSVQRHLDDAAAGVLFGDSEQNMQKLALMAPHLLKQLTRVGGELDRLSKRCGRDAAGAASAPASVVRRRTLR